MNLRTLSVAVLALTLIFLGCKKDPDAPSGAPEFAITGLHDVSFDSTVSSITLDVTVSQISGTKEAVRFSIDSLPDSFSAFMTPDSGLAPFNARIVITKTGYVPGGDYPLRITAKSASFTKSYDLNLKVLLVPSKYEVSIYNSPYDFSDYAFLQLLARRISGNGPDPISVTTSGLPPQLRANTWVQGMWQGAVSTMLYFEESPLVPAGSYPFKIHVTSPTYSSTHDMTVNVRAYEGFTVDGKQVRGTFSRQDGDWGIHSIYRQTTANSISINMMSGSKPTTDGVYKLNIGTSSASPNVLIRYRHYYSGDNYYDYISEPTTNQLTLTISGGKASIQAGNLTVKHPGNGDTKTISFSARER